VGRITDQAAGPRFERPGSPERAHAEALHGSRPMGHGRLGGRPNSSLRSLRENLVHRLLPRKRNRPQRFRFAFLSPCTGPDTEGAPTVRRRSWGGK